MDKKKLQEAVFEAARFIEKAEIILDMNTDKIPSKHTPGHFNRSEQEEALYRSKEAAAIKRSSMDLSRALSDLRRS